MNEFRFAFAPALILLIPALIMLLRWWLGQSRRMPPVLRYSDTRVLAGLDAGLRVRLRRIPDVLRLFGWVLLVFALARPQFGIDEQAVRGEGVDMVLALDISDSMAIADFNGQTRFDAARDVMSTFIDARENDYIGLVVFGEDAYYQAPPTLDHFVLKQILDEVPLAGDIGLSNRTAVGEGIAAAANMLRSRVTTGRVLILLTDGANNAGQIDPISAAQAAAAFDIRIYTIGIGTANESSESPLDEITLRQIAEISGGRYFYALSLTDLQSVYTQIDRLEQRDTSRIVRTRWHDQAWGLLWSALLMLLIERILRHTVFQSIP